MNTTTHPILYSFRRCPYAMRARLAIAASGMRVELREILLRDKPASMLEASPKGTVPVLILPDGKVIDESLDIMDWALSKSDPESWLATKDEELITENDGDFKKNLDCYKYAQRHPEPEEVYRARGEVFLQKLEEQLSQQAHLSGQAFSFTDAAIFPFIRQFAHVNKDWFNQSEYTHLRTWLNTNIASPLFTRIMEKFPVWKETNDAMYFNDNQ